MHLALYRSERPECFEEIIGQKHIVKILQNQIKSDSVSQAYLFTGTRGTGKTSTARILAKAVNCTGEKKPCGECDNCRSIKDGTFLDVIELDAASNNGVEDLRSLIDSVRYPPTVGKYKVYIIDEVHMLSQAAENAFLKTLEEPPSYAIFILATTDPEKVRATIKSRCMTLNFKRVSENDLMEGMRRICDRKGIRISDEALGVIAAKADGSVRDALSILEQCISTGDDEVTEDLVLDYIGSAGDDFYLALTDAVRDADMSSVIIGIDEMIRDGKDAKQMISDWLMHYRNLMIVKYIDEPFRVISASEENAGRLKAQAETLDIVDIERAVRLLSEYTNMARYSTQPRMLLETAAVEIMRGGDIQHETKKSVPRRRSTDKADRPAATGHSRDAAVKFDSAVKVKEPGNHVSQKVTEAPEKTQRPAAEEKPSGSSAPADVSDLEGMWEKIVDIVSSQDLSFRVIVGNNSRITGFENGEVSVTVKKNKLSIAESSKERIDSAVKEVFGAGAFVTLKGGRITEAAAEKAASNDGGQDEPDATDVARDISEMLGGLKVDVID